ncbi:hypothetical protein [uncultured Parasphingopyxis sp.]|uniref:hypothetical protein n=1 Tax=uncultured Parasphingopyxis sp. TaxID=1547918 RepID=UPI002627E1E8|nr:hypothetical protein [uncultured Parasphingopyxis sp.]
MNFESLTELKGKGESARLFPVLADSSKEGRTLSILLATMSHVTEFADAVLRPLGRPVGSRTVVEAFSEVSFETCSDPHCRPDGLLVVKTGKTVWRALIEAKVGNGKLRADQVEKYLGIAREVGADALITISNDFTLMPGKHPINVDKRLLRKTELFHLSWFSFLTAIRLLESAGTVEDRDHRFVLTELERFLLHPSAGLQRFTQMSPAWTAVLDRIRGGLGLSKSSEEVSDVVSSWHSEISDLCLLLSRRTGAIVDLKLSPKLRNDAQARVDMDCRLVSEEKLLQAALVVPNAATAIEIEADLSSRTLRIFSQLPAPLDKVRPSSRLSWLVRQLNDADGEAVRIQSHWPGRAAVIESSLNEARSDPGIHSHSGKDMLPHTFTVAMRLEDGRKFGGRNTFIAELEEIALAFYEQVLSRIRAWQAPAPRLKQDDDDDEPAEGATI